MRGIVPNKFLGEVRREFLVDSAWNKAGGKSTKNPQQDSNQNSGVRWPKSILQESALDIGLPEVAESRGGFFCYLWAVFSKRTLLTKSVVWKGAQQTLSIPPAAAEGLQVHFNMGASTMPRRQPKSVPESTL